MEGQGTIDLIVCLDFSIQLIGTACFKENDMRDLSCLLNFIVVGCFQFLGLEIFASSIGESLHSSSGRAFIFIFVQTFGSRTGMACVENCINNSFWSYFCSEFGNQQGKVIIQDMFVPFINTFFIHLSSIYRNDSFVPSINFVSTDVLNRLSMTGEMKIDDVSFSGCCY